jgi:hypothetical protein
MKLKLIAGFTLAFMSVAGISQGQQQPPAGNYNYHDAFAPFFYTKNGSEFRAADGQPGPKYWQNRADYQLSAKLNDQTNEVVGSEILNYTNNSPQKLDFLWMQLDQNLFKSDSRGSAIIPPSGSRNGGQGDMSKGGYNIKSVKLIGAKGAAPVEVKYLIDDTRMQIFLPTGVTANGGQVKLAIEYSFIVPEYGSDRTGIQKTKNGKISIPLRNGTRACTCMMILWAGMLCLTPARPSFTWSMVILT